MPFNDQDIEYRFSSRRKSIGLTVNATGKLIVAAPRGASRADISRALNRHQAWVEAKIAERRAAWDRIKDGAAFYLGKPYELRQRPGAPGPVIITNGIILVPGPPELLWYRLQDWYRSQAENLLNERVDYFASGMNLKVKPLEFKEWQRRWGECHLDGKLKFNWRLILLPPEVVDYVVVHELAHLIVPGHNPRFWRQVGAMLPDYAARRAWLNRYGTPFLLWHLTHLQHKS